MPPRVVTVATFARRTIGSLLVVYALIGLVLAGIGIFIGLDLADRVERMVSGADTTLTSASRATDAAADAFANVDTSLSEARTSTDAAAALAREASGTLAALAVAMDLSVLGAQPLQPLAGEFSASADQAAELADTLDSVGESLGSTRGDAARIAPELEDLAEALDELGGASDGPAIAPPLRLFVLLMIAWMLVQALLSLVVGVGLLRARREP